MFPLLLAFLDPGSALLIMKDGKVIEKRVEGTADIRTGRRVTPGTNFRLASVSKQFTATAILLLEKDGKLSVHDRVGHHLPSWPSYAEAVTVRHLLTHTSGLPDYDNDVPDSTNQLKDADVYRFVQRAGALYFQPGEKYQYSNTGYAILALLVEQVSGRRFADFLKMRIFEPLHMKNTVAHEEGRSIVADRAYGHSRDASGWRVTDQSATSAVLGDGGIYSSIDDLARWIRALEGCKLLPCATLERSWTSDKLNNGELTNYGFGWRLEKRDGQRVISHTGETRGFRNALIRYPDRRVAVVLLTNRNEGEPIQKAAAEARALFLP